MTHRTENNRVFDSKKILAIATGCLIFNYTYVITVTGLVGILELPGAIVQCAGISINGFPWVMVINHIYHIIMISIGISADIALHQYMWKKRNRGRNEVQLVAWRVSPPSNQDDNYKTNVPINATLIGTTTTLVIIGKG